MCNISNLFPCFRGSSNLGEAKGILPPHKFNTCCVTKALTAIRNMAVNFFQWVANLFRKEATSNNNDAPKDKLVLVPHDAVGFAVILLQAIKDKQPQEAPNVEDGDEDADIELLKELEIIAIKKVVGEVEYDRVQKEIERLTEEGGEVVVSYNITEKQKEKLFNALPSIALGIADNNIVINADYKTSIPKRDRERLLAKFPELRYEVIKVAASDLDVLPSGKKEHLSHILSNLINDWTNGMVDEKEWAEGMARKDGEYLYFYMSAHQRDLIKGKSPQVALDKINAMLERESDPDTKADQIAAREVLLKKFPELIIAQDV